MNTIYSFNVTVVYTLPQVHGECSSSSLLPLGTTTDNFEQGEEDIFEVSLPSDMGTITAITIGHDNTNPYPEWHLDRVEMESGCGGERCMFPCGRYVQDIAGRYPQLCCLVISSKCHACE